ncbi:MAG: N-acetylneuraminate synthase [Methanomicrobiales archaeon]|nr:N-acetylneuraminate synthase [Methanomicrobiales archaeon]
MKKIIEKQPYIIAETAYNHEGDFDYLLQMIDEIAELPFNAIKYHLLLDPSSYMVTDHPLFQEIEKWIFTKNQRRELFKTSNNHELDIIALCDDIESLEFINSDYPDIFAIELHATSLNDYHLLMEASQFPGTVILGVGGSTLDEISYAIDLLRQEGKTDILLMYGFQSYPTNYAEINLSKMIKIKELFGLPMGYADHTAYDDPNNEIISCMAAMMGINILEKHYTPDYGVERIDYHAAVGKEQMRRIKELMDLSLTVHGDGSLGMSQAEKNYGNTGPMKKAIVASHDIHPGDRLTIDNLTFRRTEKESPMKQLEFGKILGLKANREIRKGEVISFGDLEYNFHAVSIEDLIKIKRDSV